MKILRAMSLKGGLTSFSTKHVLPDWEENKMSPKRLDAETYEREN